MTAIADVGSEVPWGIVLACPFVAAFVLWAAITWTTARAEAEDAVQDEVSTCDHAEGMQRTGDMLRTLLAEGGE